MTIQHTRDQTTQPPNGTADGQPCGPSADSSAGGWSGVAFDALVASPPETAADRSSPVAVARDALTTLASLLAPGGAIECRLTRRGRTRLRVAVSMTDALTPRAAQVRLLREALGGRVAVGELRECPPEANPGREPAAARGVRLAPLAARLNRPAGFGPATRARDGSQLAHARRAPARMAPLLRCLLSAPRAALAVRLEPTLTALDARLELAAGQVGATVTPTQAAEAAARLGDLVSVGVTLEGDEVDAALVAATLQAFPGLTVAAGSAPAPAVMGTVGAAALLPIPDPAEGLVPGFRLLARRILAESAAIRPRGRGVALGLVDTPTGAATLRLGHQDLARHVHIHGATGTGKSTLMAGMVRCLAKAGEGLCVLDPHGTLVADLLETLPSSRHQDVVVLDAGDVEHPVPFNPLAAADPFARAALVQDLGELFYDLFDPCRTGIVGPRFESWLRMGMLTLLADPSHRASLLDVPRLFVDLQYLKARFAHVDDPVVEQFWTGEMGSTSDYHKSEMLGWFSSKFERFRSNPILRNLLGTGRDATDWEGWIAEGRIVLVDLAGGRVGRVNASLLGYLHLSRIWTALQAGGGQPRPFAIFLDEAQRFTVGPVPALAGEGRKFGARLVLAHQYAAQLGDGVRDTLDGTVGTRIVFRCGSKDARPMCDQLGPGTTPLELMRLPNFQAVCAPLVRGEPTAPCTLRIPRPGVRPDPLAADQIRRRTRTTLAVPRERLEGELAARRVATQLPVRARGAARP